MLKRCVIFFLCFVAFWVYSRAEKPARLLVLKNVRMINGIDDQILPDRTIVIQGDTITGIETAGNGKLPESAFVLDLGGQYAIPGLIDAHVHVSHGTREELETVLSRVLKGGITSVRDMSGDARILAGLRRDALVQEIESPYIYYSATLGGPTFFKDPRVITSTLGETPGEVPWARAITPETDLRQVMAEARGIGATGIKIYANLPGEEIRRIALEGHRQGLKIWSHATVFPARPSDAVRAGVDVISHSPLLVWEGASQVPLTYDRRYDADYNIEALKSGVYRELFNEMVKRGTILDATVYIFTLKDILGAGAEDRAEALARFSLEVTRQAHGSGVKVAVGTDYAYEPNKPLPNLHDEMELLVSRCGFTPLEAIQAATRINAEALGIEDRAGTIETGKRADLVILAADPTRDIRNTRQVRYIIKGGKIYIRQVNDLE